MPSSTSSAQAVGEHVARYAEVALHWAETPDAEERLAQDQERPAVAEDVDGERDGVASGPAGRLVLRGQLVRRLAINWFRAQPY